MNKLQEIINEMEADVSSAKKMYQKLTRHGFSLARVNEGAFMALEKYIPKLTLLIKEETAKDLPDEDCTCRGVYANKNCPLHYKR